MIEWSECSLSCLYHFSPRCFNETENIDKIADYVSSLFSSEENTVATIQSLNPSLARARTQTNKHIHLGSLNTSASRYPKIVNDVFLFLYAFDRSTLAHFASVIIYMASYWFWSRSSEVWCSIHAWKMNVVLFICMWWVCVLTKSKTRSHISPSLRSPPSLP